MITRRYFLSRTSAGLGAAALTSLLNPRLFGAVPGVLSAPHFPAKAKRIIYLFMSGGPSHMDLFDYKPKLNELNGQEIPASVRGKQRVTLMTRNQTNFLVAGSPLKFARHGQSGQEMSELLPHTAKIADDIAIIRSLYTEPINHDPAVTFLLTGGQLAGRPSMGCWLSYGLGTENSDLPAFVVMLSGTPTQPALSRYWHNGFLPGKHQGVQFRSQGDPVLYLTNPDGIDPGNRKQIIDGVNALNQMKYETVGDPEIEARINSYELAYKMQTSVPELMDISKEPKEVHELYGTQPGKATFANNCLLARRLAERGVRFIQLYHQGWDQHSNLIVEIKRQCTETDQATAALIMDLKQRDMLKDTLVIWGGEFGRTSYCQGKLTNDSLGRDHHPRCFTIWMAGGGIKPGITIGATDDFGYNLVGEGIHVHDFQATVLNQMGIDHTKLTYKFQGRNFRLTDVTGKVVREILA